MAVSLPPSGGGIGKPLLHSLFPLLRGGNVCSRLAKSKEKSCLLFGRLEAALAKVLTLIVLIESGLPEDRSWYYY